MNNPDQFSTSKGLLPGIFRGACLLLLMFCALNQSGMAQEAPVPKDALSQYEQTIFNHAYTDETLAKRLDRLEGNIFGESQPGSELQRKERLLKVLGQTREMAPPAFKPLIEPSEQADTQAGTMPAGGNVTNGDPNGSPDDQALSRPPDATDYPKVTALEREVFGRDFIRDPIENRLTRLEKKVFGNPYPLSALSDRVDKLLSRYPQLNIPTVALNRERYPNSAIRDLPDSSSQFIGGSRDVYTKVEALERTLLNNQTHSGELLTERLDRLEKQLYGKSYGGESVDFRVSRLMKNFEVGTNGLQPRPAFQERPAYQSPPQVITSNGAGGYTSQPSGSQSVSQSISQSSSGMPRQNIQIGSSIAQSSTHQYSQEMLDMLPPDIRAQLSSGSISSQGSGTVVSAPSTVIIERQTPVYPGFQQYGNGSPIQYYNYYGSPQGQTTTQSTTTVIQPDGSSTVYSYPGSTVLPGTTQILPNPAYVGDPAFLQQLNNLEMNLFGQVNMVEPVFIRLGKMEAALLGQVYQGYPETQRLATLQKAYQMQSIGRLMGKGKAGDIGRAAGSTILGIPLTPPGNQGGQSGQTSIQNGVVSPYGSVPYTTMPYYSAGPGVYTTTPYSGMTPLGTPTGLTPP